MYTTKSSLGWHFECTGFLAQQTAQLIRIIDYMDVQASKIELAKLILSINSPELIEKSRKLLVNETDDF